MSTKSKTKAAKAAVPASIVWFEIPADDLARARKFYTGLFGWKISPFGPMEDYLHVETGGKDASPDGGIMKRKDPRQPITSYVSVASVAKSSAKVEKFGGKICVPRTAVPGMGYFVVCQDTEENVFALWERDDQAK